MFAEVSEIFWLGAEVSELGQKMEVPLIVASEEEEEGMDWLVVEGAVFNWQFREDDSDDVVRLLKEKVAGMGDANPVREGGRHELFSVEE